MKRSYRLQRIVDIANTVERIAAGALAASEDELSRCRAQLEQLRAYRAEYQSPFQVSGEPFGAQTLQEYHLFVQRLNELIETLEQRLAELGKARDRKRDEWQDRHRRSDVLGDIQGRAARVEQAIALGRVEREIDDQAASRLGGR